MSAIEKIVRPFQSADVFTGRTLPPGSVPARDAPEEATLIWECPSSGQYVSGPPPGVMNFKVEWEEDKSRRVTEKVRVENPDDSDQYVTVERIKKMVLVKNTTREELPIKIDWAAEPS